MKKLSLIPLLILFIAPVKFILGVKTVVLPDNIRVEENIFKETFIRNLSEVEIYRYFSLSVIKDKIYIANSKPREIVMLSLQGKLLGRAGKEGQGPGEFSSIGIVSELDGNIAILDYGREVLTFYTRALKYIKEIRLKKYHMCFLVDRGNNYICFGSGERDFYFDKYSKNMTYIESFGPSVSSARDRKKKKLFDDVRCALYIPEDNGIWASFKNRYDIRYYKNQELAVEIKAEKGFFKTEEEYVAGAGRTVVWCKESRALCLAKNNGKLFYFFRNNGVSFCDIFDSNSYRLLRRIAMKNFLRQVSHYKENIFYSLSMDESEEDLYLLKLEF
jgi:hypothetical protein